MLALAFLSSSSMAGTLPEVPEPMVFDLVRGLGARKGELEVNTLVLTPLQGRPYKAMWAPEVEYAVADGLAFEIELPMEDTRLVALKFAGQVTFGSGLGGSFIHGTQAIVEQVLEERATEATATYLAGVQLDERWSVFGMFGARGIVGAGRPHFEAIQNVSLFAQVSHRLVLGMEVNVADGGQGARHVLAMPQVHADLGSMFSFQVGVGAAADVDGVVPTASARVLFQTHARRADADPDGQAGSSAQAGLR